MIINLIILIIVITIVALIIFQVCKYFKRIIKKLETTIETQKQDFDSLLSQKKSSEVVLGFITEQLAPTLKAFENYDPTRLKFLGQPIDYIHFGDDGLTFIEVKSGRSRLTTKQIDIKKLVQQKKVFWDTIRIPDKIKKDVNDDKIA